jgi:hypothetical protein
MWVPGLTVPRLGDGQRWSAVDARCFPIWLDPYGFCLSSMYSFDLRQTVSILDLYYSLLMAHPQGQPITSFLLLSVSRSPKRREADCGTGDLFRNVCSICWRQAAIIRTVFHSGGKCSRVPTLYNEGQMPGRSKPPPLSRNGISQTTK